MSEQKKYLDLDGLSHFWDKAKEYQNNKWDIYQGTVSSYEDLDSMLSYLTSSSLDTVHRTSIRFEVAEGSSLAEGVGAGLCLGWVDIKNTDDTPLLIFTNLITGNKWKYTYNSTSLIMISNYVAVVSGTITTYEDLFKSVKILNHEKADFRWQGTLTRVNLELSTNDGVISGSCLAYLWDQSTRHQKLQYMYILNGNDGTNWVICNLNDNFSAINKSKVDSELSNESTNPVQNKVVAIAINNIKSQLDGLEDLLASI